MPLVGMGDASAAAAAGPLLLSTALLPSGPGCGCSRCRELMCRGPKKLLLLPNVLLSLSALLLSLVLLPTLPARLMPGALSVPGWFCRQAAAFTCYLLITCGSFALGLKLKSTEPGMEDDWKHILSFLASGTAGLEPNVCTSILFSLFPQRFLFLRGSCLPHAMPHSPWKHEHKHLNLRMNII